MYDKFNDECGLMGIWNVSEAANHVYLGLYAQQHRGQEGAGVVAYQQSADKFSNHRSLGLVSDIFNGFDFHNNLPGSSAVGHVRYTTAGGNLLANVQPFFSEIASGRIAIAHNGNLVNADELKSKLIKNGAIFQTTSDTEVILHLIASAGSERSKLDLIIQAIEEIKGAYCLLIMFDDRLFAVRDPHGLRPLSLAKLGDGYAIASETCAFDLIGADFVRDIAAGEILEISRSGEISSHFPFGVTKPAHCIFEYVYFSRPDSQVYGKNVYEIRKEMGRQLAREHHVEADLVVPVPDSGVPAAIGYAQESGLPFEFGLVRNHYVGRTFIEPHQSIRDFGVKIKLNPNLATIKGKRIVVVDDSIVRGTTSKKLVNMFKEAGAKEIHFRVSSPPTSDPCHYGIDTPEKDRLIAANNSIEEIAKYLEVDTLGYLSVEGLYKAVKAEKGSFCDACFTGNYPIKIGDQQKKEQGSLGII